MTTDQQWALWVGELREWVGKCYKRQPVWQVQPFGTHWFCPYCGRIGVMNQTGEDMVDQITDHLASACEPFTEIGTPPIFPIAELQKRALHFYVKKRLTSSASWQVRDRQGRWVCPYCTHPTDIVLQGKVDKHILGLITGHILKCPTYEAEGQDSFKTVDQIQQNVVKRTTMQKVVQKLTKLVQEQDVWKVLTPAGTWVCPYCRRVQDNIVCRTPIDIQVNLPQDIAKHFHGNCEGYRKKVAPATSAAKLYNEAMGLDTRASDTPVEQLPRVTQVDLGRITQVMMGVQQDLEEQSQKMERELQLAREKQLQMLPDIPTIDDLSFAIHYQPCEHLAGDFYDFIDLGDGNLGISIGDVTGHGVNAALVMGMCKKVMNLVARFAFSPRQSLALANEEIIKDLDGQTFVSMWYGILNPATGNLRFSRAGHEPLMLYNSKRSPRHQAFKPRGMAVGLIAGQKFEQLLEESEIQLMPGDMLCLYTDGIPELQNPYGEQFGRERIEEAIQNCGAEPTPDMAVQGILQYVESFCQGVPIDDDLTIVCFRWK